MPRCAAPTTPQRVPMYPDPRDGRTPGPYGDPPMDRWSGSGGGGVGGSSSSSSRGGGER